MFYICPCCCQQTLEALHFLPNVFVTHSTKNKTISLYLSFRSLMLHPIHSIYFLLEKESQALQLQPFILITIMCHLIVKNITSPITCIDFFFSLPSPFLSLSFCVWWWLSFESNRSAGGDDRRAHDEYNGSGNQNRIVSSVLLTSILIAALGRFLRC